MASQSARLGGVSILISWLTIVLVLWLVSLVQLNADCAYPAVFAFGDSLTDTGNAIKTSPIFFTSTQKPYGETFFKRPASRYSDGRLIIDFLGELMIDFAIKMSIAAQSLGLPFLNPYLAYKEAGTDFSNGVNYAVAGATIQGSGTLLFEGGVNVLTRDNLVNVQLPWHLEIKRLATSNALSDIKLPSPQSFSKGLYFLLIGGNDYGSVFIRQNLRFGSMSKPFLTNAKELQLVPTVVGSFIQGIETLYANEARHFIILNIGPEGCGPLYLKLFNGTLDNLGCLEVVNQLDQAHNKMLLEALEGLKEKYADIDIMYGDLYTAYRDVVANPSANGFEEVINACCGAGPGVKDQFKIMTICNRFTYVCPNPSQYVVWDGIHNTDAFNRHIINQFIAGNYIIPANSLYCATQIKE